MAEAAAQTQALVRRSQPGTMFLDALRALLTARQVYLMWLARGRSSSPPPSEALRLGWQEGGTPHPGGIRVGWFDPADGVVLLEPAAALGAVAVYLDELYSAAPLRIDAVYNALHQQDAIARSSTGRATVTVRVDGQQMRLLALKGRALFERDD